MSKFKDIFKVASGIAKPFVPGIGGSILDVVNSSIENHNDPGNSEGLKALAENDHEQDQAILAIHARQNDLDARLKALEGDW